MGRTITCIIFSLVVTSIEKLSAGYTFNAYASDNVRNFKLKFCWFWNWVWTPPVRPASFLNSATSRFARVFTSNHFFLIFSVENGVPLARLLIAQAISLHLLSTIDFVFAFVNTPVKTYNYRSLNQLIAPPPLESIFGQFL